MLSIERLRISKYLVLDPENSRKCDDEAVDFLSLDGLMFSNFSNVLSWLALDTKVSLPHGDGLIGRVKTLEWIVNIHKVFAKELPGWRLIEITEEMKSLLAGGNNS